jgi:hypothetical protein
LLRRLTNIIPRAEGNGISLMLLLNTSPPEPSDDSINLFNEGFRKKG